MSNPLIALAQAADDWRERAIPAEVDWDCRRATLDWFAAMLPGCVDGAALPLSLALASGRGWGRAIAYVDGNTGSPRHAAFLNGTASHTTEFDDIFRDGGYHPGSPTISAALAVAQDEASGYKDFRRAVIGGYEVGCRLALALQPSHYRNWHITATVGTIGAAVSTAMLKGGRTDEIAHAIAIATSFAGGHQENLQGEGLTKALHCGHAADAGVLAGLAAAAGVTGSLDSLHAPYGYAAATSESRGNWDAALQGIGEWTPISRMTFKNHGCCGHIFPTLDALNHMLAEAAFTPADIERIDVEGYGPTVAICDRRKVESARDARFSLQYCVSALLHLGRVRLDAFSPQALRNPELRAFMDKVFVREDAEIAAAYPGRRMARVRVAMKDGSVLEHFQNTRKGDPDDPLTDDELIAKFDELATVAVSPVGVAKLRASILDGQTLPGTVALRADRAA